MKTKFCFLTCFVLVFEINYSIAQNQPNDCGCSIALNKDIIKESKSVNQVISLLKTVTEQQYNEMKTSFSSGGVPFLEDIIPSSVSFTDFQKRIQFYQSMVNYHDNYSMTTQYESYITSPIAYTKWGECIQSCITKNRQTYFDAYFAYADTAEIKIVLGYKGDLTTSKLKVNISTSNGILYYNNKKVKNNYKVDLSSQSWDNITIKRNGVKDQIKVVVTPATPGNYSPLTLKSEVKNDYSPLIKSEFFKQDKELPKGSDILSLSVGKDNIKADKTYEIIVDMPFWKNHKQDCPSSWPCHFGYCAGFMLQANDMVESRTVDISGCDKKTPTNLSIDGVTISGKEILESNGISIKLKQSGCYYSSCNENTNDPLLFQQGGRIVFREIYNTKQWEEDGAKMKKTMTKMVRNK